MNDATQAGARGTSFVSVALAQTATLPTLERALAWRARALDAVEGVADAPERPRPAKLATPSRAVTVDDASRRLCRGMVTGSVRTNRGRLYKPSSIRKYEECPECAEREFGPVQARGRIGCDPPL